MESLICYCFGYTVSDIKWDCLANGKSTIIDRIVSEKSWWMSVCYQEPQGSLMPCRRPPGGGHHHKTQLNCSKPTKLDRIPPITPITKERPAPCL